MTLAEEMERAANGTILFAVIGEDWDQDHSHPLFGQCLPWSEVRAALDYELDNSDVNADDPAENAVYAWTADRVLFVYEYDGATAIYWVPRNPGPCEPEFSGNCR
jgi:hypothetical protein